MITNFSSSGLTFIKRSYPAWESKEPVEPDSSGMFAERFVQVY